MNWTYLSPFAGHFLGWFITKNRLIYDSLAKARHGYDVRINVSQANDAEGPAIFWGGINKRPLR